MSSRKFLTVYRSIMCQDLVRLLQPTAVFLRLCGVCPSSLRKCHIPNSNVAYSCLIVLPVIWAAVEVVPNIYLNYNDITCFFGIVTALSLAFSSVVTLLFSYILSPDLVQFFKIMESARRSLYALNIMQPVHPTPLTQITWLALFICPLITVVSVIIYLKETNLIFLGVVFSSLVRAGLVCKVRCLMDLVNHKLVLLNWHLNYLNRYWPPFLPRRQSQDNTLKDLSQEENWLRTKFVFTTFDTLNISPHKIKEFNKAHLKLHYAYKKLNSIFSIPILLMYITSGLCIAFNIFLVSCKQCQVNNFTTLIRITEEIIGILLVSTLCSITENEFRRTARLVHNLMDDDSYSESVIQELENFSKILLHRKMCFSAGGFFDINLKIITRMASLFAPIILFLVQNDNRPRAARNIPK